MPNPGVYGKRRWMRLSGAMVAGGTLADIGNDSSDTGTIYAALTISADQELYFRDSGLYIYSSANGQLDIVADTTLALSGAITADSTINAGTFAAPTTIIKDVPLVMISGEVLADQSGGEVKGLWVRTKVSKEQPTTACIGIEAQCRVNGAASAAATLGAGHFAGIWAYFEQSGTTALNTGALAAACSCTVEGATTLTIDSGAILAGLVVDSSVHGSATNNGTFDGIYVKKASGALDFVSGLEFTDCVSSEILKVADDGTVCHDTDTHSTNYTDLANFVGYITVKVGAATRYLWLSDNKPSAGESPS